MKIGRTFNESAAEPDPVTGRTVRRLTTAGEINQTPTYHTGSGFTADGAHIAFVSVREGATWVLRGSAADGELMPLWRAPGIGNRNYIHRGMGLDLPPRYCGGGDGRTPRIWLLDLQTRRARALKESFPGPFQTHQAWLWDGSAICYHGGLPGGGEYFGIATPAGETLWERSFPQATHYGHNTRDARRPALIIDGAFSGELLQWLYHDDDRADGAPRLEPICRHGTEWRSLPGQYSHPHPLTDPAGRSVSFTVARGGRSDVCVVELEG